MRGKVYMSRYYLQTVRITPAYAGKSVVEVHTTGKGRDHPRLCGEKQAVIVRERFTRGSPPPMRGKGNFSLLCSDLHGITPAYAGKRGRGFRKNAVNGDHPRLCGEKRLRRFFVIVSQGSPPPMRGKGPYIYSHNARIRITPAYAGKRKACQEVSRQDEDHPRLCGEKFIFSFIVCLILGSPPPMRGKVIDTLSGKFVIRITPAYAGKSRRRYLPPSLSWDHPRLCGEKLSHRRVYFPRLGSPPPMRGKVRMHEGKLAMDRITPAYAGKSRCHNSGTFPL